MEHNNLENIEMPLIQYDRFGRSVWHNKLAQRMLITPMEEILGLPSSPIDPFSLHIARYFKTLHLALKTAEPAQFELSFDPLPKGESKTFLIRFLPELDDTGSLTGVLAMAEEMQEENSEYSAPAGQNL